ncbi:MAG: multicopper oxidase domain-containing protein [Ktedonobacteraceae bacterium]|nr:multicopper oxidase domain-containing protein [Ktedonobacteraceae bacterium]MBV8821200.1 multicopper oxidase domain-containing protein [Ktedonobacteraceae bacterium]MBV9020437.1 multicopper oxidase domain-containing protein [Ktedonobacteraceae bacterium]
MAPQDQNTSVGDLESLTEGKAPSTTLFRPEPEHDEFSRRTLLKGFAAGSGLAVATPVGSALASHNVTSQVAHASVGGRLREYWIQADSFQHNLVPTGYDGMMGDHYTANQTSFWAIGYRAYTPGWQKPLAGNNDIGLNAGIPGPIIRAEVGDTIRIHFRNQDTHYKFAHSMHPHGVFYTVNSDASWLAALPRPSGAVEVGQSYTYEWIARPDSVGTWLYHDHSKPQGPKMLMEFGAELGLFGMIAVTDEKTTAVDQEIFLFFHDLYHDDVPSLSQDFDCFNGYAFVGNTPKFTARVGDRVRWRIAALGKEFHIFHLHGHRWPFQGRFDDSLVLGPATTRTFEYVEDNPGTWLYHCHVTDHMMGGMAGLYVVTT